jgi:hypothetical protein
MHVPTSGAALGEGKFLVEGRTAHGRRHGMVSYPIREARKETDGLWGV